jgi:hypothetical protein
VRVETLPQHMEALRADATSPLQADLHELRQGFSPPNLSSDNSLAPQSGHTPIPQNLQLLPALRLRADIPIQRMLRLQIRFDEGTGSLRQTFYNHFLIKIANKKNTCTLQYGAGVNRQTPSY